MQEAIVKVMKNLIEAIYIKETPEQAIEWCLEQSELSLGESYKNELIDYLKLFTDEQ